MRQAWMILVLLSTVAMRGQVGRRLVKVDDAPPPSERFPAKWYPENSWANMDGPVVDAPFTATTLLKTTARASADGPSSENVMRGLKMRDGAGRTRDEEIFPGTVGVEGFRQIEVNDVVRHCQFRWSEPFNGPSQPVAEVRCYRKLSWSDDGMEAEMRPQTPVDIKPYPWEDDRIEPLGEKNIEGFRAFGVRQTSKATASAGGNSVGELWWSPELRETLLLQSVQTLLLHSVQGEVETTIEMKDIKRGEPDGALFYPPAGWKIVSSPDPQDLPVTPASSSPGSSVGDAPGTAH